MVVVKMPDNTPSEYKILDDHNKLSPKDELLLNNHIDRLNFVLWKELCVYGVDLNIKIIAAPYRKFIKTILEKHGLDDFRIWEGQIETFAEIIAYYLKPGMKKPLVLIGATQAGKTGLIMLCFILEIVMFVKTGEHYEVIYLSPNKTSLKVEAKEDFDKFCKLYDAEITTSNGGKIGLSEYRKEEGKNNHEAIVGRGPDNLLEGYRSRIAEYHAKGRNVILLIDECDFGSDVKGVLNKFRNCLSNKDLTIFISATPYELCNLENTHRIFCRLYEGYVGYGFFDGQLLDSRYEPILPEVISFSDVQRQAKFNIDLRFVDRNLYLNERNYNNKVKKLSFFLSRKRQLNSKQKNDFDFAVEFDGVSHSDYKKRCERELVALCKGCLLENNELNANGIIIRFFKKNTDVIKFIEDNKKEFGDIKVVSYQGDEAKVSLEEHLINQGISKTDKKVIYVTSGQRMGNRLKDSDRIYYGADFSVSSNLRAIMQGLLGRMTGKKSVAPIMFVHESVKEELDVYIESNGGDFLHTPSTRTKLDGIKPFGKTIRIFLEPTSDKRKISFDSLGSPECGEWLTKWVQSVVSGEREGLAGGLHYTKTATFKSFWDHFNKKFEVYEQSLGLPVGTFVRYSAEGSDEVPFIDDRGDSYGRTIGGRSSLEGEDKSDTVKGKKNGLQPQIMMVRRRNRNGKGFKWFPVAIRLCLVSNKNKSTINRRVPMPNEKSLAFSLLSEKERANNVCISSNS